MAALPVQLLLLLLQVGPLALPLAQSLGLPLWPPPLQRTPLCMHMRTSAVLEEWSPAVEGEEEAVAPSATVRSEWRALLRPCLSCRALCRRRSELPGQASAEIQSEEAT